MLWNILISTLVLAAMWAVLQTKPVFRITVCNGRARKSGGRVPGEFLGDIENVCREEGITSTTIRGMSEHEGIRLAFEKSVPAHVRQRIRNSWSFHA